MTGNPRGDQPDGFPNRFAAIAAGLGRLTVAGRVATPEFGVRERFIALVTDAPLEASPLCSAAEGLLLCSECDKPCVEACPSRAFTCEPISIDREGETYSFRPTDNALCDWTKR